MNLRSLFWGCLAGTILLVAGELFLFQKLKSISQSSQKLTARNQSAPHADLSSALARVITRFDEAAKAPPELQSFKMEEFKGAFLKFDEIRKQNQSPLLASTERDWNRYFEQYIPYLTNPHRPAKFPTYAAMFKQDLGNLLSELILEQKESHAALDEAVSETGPQGAGRALPVLFVTGLIALTLSSGTTTYLFYKTKTPPPNPLTEKLAQAELRLKEQSEKISEMDVIQDQLRVAEDRLKEAEHFRRLYDDSKAKLIEAERKQVQLKEYKLKYEAAEQQLSALEKRIREIPDLASSLREAEAKLAKAQEELTSTNAKNSELEHQVHALTKTPISPPASASDSQELAARDSRICELERTIEDQKEALEDLEPFKAKCTSYENKLKSNERLLKESQVKVQELVQKIESQIQLNVVVTEREEQIKELTSRIQELSSIPATQEAETTELKNRVKELEKSLKANQKKLSRLEKDAVQPSLFGAASAEKNGQSSATLESVHLNEIVSPIIDLFQATPLDMQMKLSKSISSIQGDSEKLELALMHLCLAARKALPDGGRFLLTTDNLLLDDTLQEKWPYYQPEPGLLWSIVLSGEKLDVPSAREVFEDLCRMDYQNLQNCGKIGRIVADHKGYIELSNNENQFQINIYFSLKPKEGQIQLDIQDLQEEAGQGSV